MFGIGQFVASPYYVSKCLHDSSHLICTFTCNKCNKNKIVVSQALEIECDWLFFQIVQALFTSFFLNVK